MANVHADECAFFREMCSVWGRPLSVAEAAAKLLAFAHRFCRPRAGAVYLGTLNRVASVGPELTDLGACTRLELGDVGTLFLDQPRILDDEVMATVARYGGQFLRQAALAEELQADLDHHRTRHKELEEWTDVLSALVQGLPHLTRELSREAFLVTLRERLQELFPWHTSAVLAMGDETFWGSAPELVRLCRESSQGVHFEDLTETRLEPLGPGERSLLGCPVHPDGALLVGASEENAFNRQDWMALSVLANHVSSAWEVALAYRQLQESESQLIHSAKLAAVGQLAAGVAHELNNPMGSIQLALDLVRRQGVGQNKAVERVLDTASRACERGKDIIHKLLYFSRDAHKGHKRQGLSRVTTTWQPAGRVDLNAAVVESADLFRLQLDQDKVKLELELAPDPLWVRGNLGELVQILGNLLLNARDAVRGLDPSWVRVRTRTADGDVVLEVEDSGPGVPADVRDKIFDPFFTTRPVGEGTGLGLSVSRQIAEHHGGALTLRGQVFELRLPGEAASEAATQ